MTRAAGPRTPSQRYGQAGAEHPVLGAAPPGELGAVHDRRVHRRHLAATMLDLADRGHLSVVDAGNDPDVGYALDWYLLLPGERAPAGVDATDAVAAATARPVLVPPSSSATQVSPAQGGTAPGPDGAVLRPHEQAFLDVVSASPSRLLSRVRAAPGAHDVLGVLADDVVERGWWRDRPGPRLRARAGRVVAAELRAAKTRLKTGAGAPETTAVLLAPAVALGLEALWTARLGQQRPSPPQWFTPGASRTARGWLGVCGAASAMAAVPPPGGGAGAASCAASTSTGPAG